MSLMPDRIQQQNFWVKDHRQIYLIGNPLIWWNGTLAVAVYLIVRGLIVVREKRGFKDLRRRECRLALRMILEIETF